MRLASYRTATVVAGLLSASTSFAQDNVRAYAAFCYAELGVTATDLENTMGRLGSACSLGTKLTTTHNGIELERIPLGDRQSPNFLKTCDAPAWLNSGVAGADKQCYGASYITPLEITDALGTLRTDVKGALLCRHKTRDPRPDARGFPADDDYDDIAMILHNKKSGKTCWFQTEEGDTAFLDGRAVVPPHLDTKNFWLTPSRTGAIKCAQCHDNGPWMNSQWVYTAHQGFKDGLGKYETPKYGTTAFHDWKATDDFVTVGRTGIQGTDLDACTSCHKLSARIDWDPLSPSHRYNGTYENWFDYSSGRKEVPQATVTEAGRARTAADYIYTHWMPTYFERHPPTPIQDLRPPDAATYDRQYKKHLTELKICMETPRADRRPPSPCKTKTAMLNNTAPSGTGAMVSATVVETGVAYTAVAAAAGTAPTPGTTVLAPGQSLRLGWQADATYDGCTIEATMPAGVSVSVSGVPEPISSGSGWELPDAPPLVGPLTEPGAYEFAIYCRDTHRASLRFQVGTTGPASLVKLVTSVNKAIQATAINSKTLMQPFTTTNVTGADSVQLTWIAYNVLPDSCALQGPDTTSAEDTGSKVIAFSSLTDQVYVFRCIGANDGVTRTVSSTLHPAGSISADLMIQATASPNPVGAGNTVKHTIVVANSGPAAAAPVTVKDDLPPATTFVSCSATAGGICGGSANNRTIDFGTLAAGASASIDIVARVGSTTPSGTLLSNAVSVSSPTFDANPTNNVATVAAIVGTATDTTRPLIVPTVTGTLGANGWYTSNVTVSWSVTDPESGIASSAGCATTTMTSDTAGSSVNCSATNGAGLQDSASVAIKIDKMPTAITGLPVAGCLLWPPNHKLVQVGVVSASAGPSGIKSFIVTGLSNEPETGDGDRTAPDIVIAGMGVNPRTVQLRAERSGRGHGRIYTIRSTATNNAGITSSGSATCVVPHSPGD